MADTYIHYMADTHIRYMADTHIHMVYDEGGVSQEQKMLKGHLPRVMYHQIY